MNEICKDQIEIVVVNDFDF